MRIVFVSTNYPERGKPTTGLPNYLYRVSTALVQMGHEPVILSAGRRDDHRKEKGIDIYTIHIKYIDCGAEALGYIVNALYKGYILNQKLNKLLKMMPIDIIQFTSLEGIAIFYKGKIPAVMRLSSYAKTSFASYQTYMPFTVRVMSFMERISAYRCKAVFAPCKNTAVAFGMDSGRRVKVIETPFINDVEEYDNSYAEKLKETKYVLYFGTLYVEKGIFIIGEILEKFLKTNPHYQFVFIGESTEVHGKNSVVILKEMAGECADKVTIWPALPHSQLYPIIINADFVVLPSYMENLSNACIEAMYFGKVVIGTEGASFEQLISHGKNGLLCKIKDAEDLFEKMQMAVSMNKGQKKQMEILAQERISKLKPEYAVKKLLYLYNYLI